LTTPHTRGEHGKPHLNAPKELRESDPGECQGRAERQGQVESQDQIERQGQGAALVFGRVPVWTSIGVGLLVGIAFEIMVIVLQVTGARPVPTDEQFNLEFGFGARLTIWIGFAITYLALGLRAFLRCDRAELVRRVLAKPLPASGVKRVLLAGGGGAGWPVAIALVAFVTIITALLSRSQATNLVLVLAAGTVATC
jgi:hypothetical protein